MPNSETHIVANNEQQKFYPYSGRFYVNRHSFWNAGQDSYTQPPAQNEDLFELLTNVEPVTRGILERRRGYQLFSNQSPVSPYTLTYSFRNETQALRKVVATSTSNVIAFNEDGSSYLNTIFTPSMNASEPRMVLSRDYGYFADGVASDYKKWDGTVTTNNLTNWGISGASVASSTVGPNAPGTAASSSSGGGAVPWANPNNIKVADGLFASCTTAPYGLSQNLFGTNFGFSVNGTILGIQVDVKYTGTNISNLNGIGLSLTKDGVTGAALKNLLPVPSSNTQISFGNSNDLWGVNWIAADINSSNFGIIIQFSQNAGTSVTVNIDYVQVTIYTQPGALTFTTNTATTNIILLNGRTYFFVFNNAVTGHNSPLSAASNTTGPLAGSQVNLTNIGISTDSQVNFVNILATADGNDQTTLYLVGSVPNGTTTFNDTVSDNVLITRPLYLNTDAFGSIHGVANNNPPPTINFPTKHKGRIFGSIGQSLYFSKNLDEVTTANGLITGKWEEAWPATNQIDVSESAETVQGLFSDGETLWIGTERHMRRLIGDSPSNFQKPEIQFNEAGLLNQDCWKVVFAEGQAVGTAWLTPDFKVIFSDFNTFTDVGTPIQNILNSINTAALSTIHASYVSKGPAEYYMLYIPTGSNTYPDTVVIYNLHNKRWFVWQPTDQIASSLYFFDVNGLPRWLFSTAAGPLYEWSNSVLQDRVNNTPVSYPVTIRTSWMDFGDYNLKKFINQIIPTTADTTGLTIAADAGSNEQDFSTPTVIVPATTVIPTIIPDDVFVPLAGGPGSSRAFRFTFVSPASTIQNVLTGYSIESGVLFRY